MLRGFRLHRCPYWIRPSITVSNHNGILHHELNLKCSSHISYSKRVACCSFSMISSFSPLHWVITYYAGVLFSTKKHPRTKELMVCLSINKLLWFLFINKTFLFMFSSLWLSAYSENYRLCISNICAGCSYYWLRPLCFCKLVAETA